MSDSEQRTQTRAGATLAERATWPAKEAWWSAQDRFLWPLNDRVREIVERAGWRLSDAGWAVRKAVVWPVSDRIPDGELAQHAPARAAMGAVCVFAIAAGTAGALAVGFSGEAAPSAEERLALEKTTVAPAPIAARTEPAPEGPLLNGSQPSFRPTENRKVIETLRELRNQRTLAAEGSGAAGTGAATADAAGTGSSSDAQPAGSGPSAPAQGGNAAAGSGDSSGSGDEGAALAPGAGPESGASQERTPREEWTPKSVSRLFATAFVLYEIGKGNDRTERIFRQTAGKELIRSLRERPPRQPARGRVPRAEVANVVEGKRDGRMLTVSVSLVRISGLSELRLDLRKSEAGWRVVSVRG